ncbi:MAG: sialate O-acetylesterase [Fibrobacterota bacterium]
MKFSVSALFILLTTVTLCAQTVTLTAMPKRLQLFSRDASDSATVLVSGTVQTTSIDSASLTLYKNGTLMRRQATRLVYGVSGAPFTFTSRLHAELSYYKFELRVGTTLLPVADSVAAGDAYIMEGQSNSVADPLWTFISPWLRSFGTRGDTTDTNWNTAQIWLGHGVGAISVTLARNIVIKDSVPVCILSGGQSSTGIESHMRDLNPLTIYGNLHQRAMRAGLKNTIKAVFWHQGEANTSSVANASTYRNTFYQLVDSWKGDYPGVQKVYLFQIGCATCGGVSGGNVLREQQREIPEGHPDISIMSNTNVPRFDGCHYADTAGYITMGDWLYGLVARDFYGSSNTVYITPPNILSAQFASPAHTTLVLTFDQPVVPTDTSLRHFFSLGTVWDIADSIRADTVNHTLSLFLHSPSTATKVGYIPTVYPSTGLFYNGPWLVNPRGIGALTFWDFPITTGGTGVEDTVETLKAELLCTPNPFNPSITFRVPSQSHGTTLAVYDARGQRVADLVRSLKNGQAVWNAAGFPSGVYVVKVSTEGGTRVKRITLMK